jgi:hypothetical protein
VRASLLYGVVLALLCRQDHALLVMLWPPLMQCEGCRYGYTGSQNPDDLFPVHHWWHTAGASLHQSPHREIVKSPGRRHHRARRSLCCRGAAPLLGRAAASARKPPKVPHRRVGCAVQVRHMVDAIGHLTGTNPTTGADMVGRAEMSQQETPPAVETHAGV